MLLGLGKAWPMHRQRQGDRKRPAPSVNIDERECGVLQGFHSGGLPMALLGVGKGVIGLAVRPTLGVLEMTSKSSYGMGLVCLGR
jgi:hypothetical protein